MRRIALFAGTSEGRILLAKIGSLGLSATVFTAESYGAEYLSLPANCQLRSGRLDKAALATALSALKPDLILDATHPYAEIISRYLSELALDLDLPLKRILRERLASPAQNFATAEDLLAYLRPTEGVIFSALGLKAATWLCQLPNFRERVYLRLLPRPEGLSHCLALGFRTEQLIAMQGPFSQALNEAMFTHCAAKYLLCKESGTAGGEQERWQAAQRLGLEVLCLARPAEAGATISLSEALSILTQLAQPT